VLHIPPNVKHGEGLVCSHEGCQRKGIKFLYCIDCKAPVAKANFGNRHKHGKKHRGISSSSSSQKVQRVWTPTTETSTKDDQPKGSTPLGKKSDYDRMDPTHHTDSTPVQAAEMNTQKRESPPEVLSTGLQEQPMGEQDRNETKKSKHTEETEEEFRRQEQYSQAKSQPSCDVVGAVADHSTTSTMPSFRQADAESTQKHPLVKQQRPHAPTEAFAQGVVHQSGLTITTTPDIVDWNSLVSAGRGQMSSNKRLELWRFLLENGPSPIDSSSDSPTKEQFEDAESSPATSAAVDGKDSRAFRVWMDRILWISDPENWSPPQETSSKENPLR
jgi:hypothetical protein